jgi:hypothetical protein
VWDRDCGSDGVHNERRDRNEDGHVPLSRLRSVVRPKCTGVNREHPEKALERFVDLVEVGGNMAFDSAKKANAQVGDHDPLAWPIGPATT